MFNLLRMDLRRLFKTRSFYIILGVTAGLILMVVLLTAVVSDPETLDYVDVHGGRSTTLTSGCRRKSAI